MANEASTQLSLYLVPGMRAELRIPINSYNNNAMFPTQNKTYEANNKAYTLKKGFYEESDGTIGELLDLTDTSKFGVIYWHKKPEKNAVWYITAHPKIKILWNIISVPIHDHSSIVQGGPAYGTYFSDDIIDTGGE